MKPIILSNEEILEQLSCTFSNVKTLEKTSLPKDTTLSIHRVFSIKTILMQVGTYEVKKDEFQRVLIVGGFEVFNF